jgi:transcriptional regulator with XRE-family HTH domain
VSKATAKPGPKSKPKPKPKATAKAEAKPASNEVGDRLRVLRRRRQMTLEALAKRAGVSASFISQVECGRSGASLNSLQRIAHALDVSISDLFEPHEGDRARVLRVADRPVLKFGELRKYLLTPRPLEHLEVMIGIFEPGSATGDEPYSHGDSEELCFVVSGSVEVQIGSQLHEMRAGDSIDYRSSTPHFFRNPSTTEAAEVLWVISPPSY